MLASCLFWAAVLNYYLSGRWLINIRLTFYRVHVLNSWDMLKYLSTFVFFYDHRDTGKLGSRQSFCLSRQTDQICNIQGGGA